MRLSSVGAKKGGSQAGRKKHVCACVCARVCGSRRDEARRAAGAISACVGARKGWPTLGACARARKKEGGRAVLAERSVCVVCMCVVCACAHALKGAATIGACVCCVGVLQCALGVATDIWYMSVERSSRLAWVCVMCCLNVVCSIMHCI